MESCSAEAVSFETSSRVSCSFTSSRKPERWTAERSRSTAKRIPVNVSLKGSPHTADSSVSIDPTKIGALLDVTTSPPPQTMKNFGKHL
ncbi:MAG: hypothetical protein PHF18_13320 [Methanosarcina sp.]|uniref:hypothetical protein n=1 Tax=Methanosarcina sp. TaxID=2213 RepID=UPI00261ED847|nr:hypothetical protein [Methanosarcina sp.]MDD3247807.1 hypothetical protein [Methanosarcina sp.]